MRVRLYTMEELKYFLMDASGIVTPCDGTLLDGVLHVGNDEYFEYAMHPSCCVYAMTRRGEKFVSFTDVKLPHPLGSMLYPSPIVWAVQLSVNFESLWSEKYKKEGLHAFIDIIDNNTIEETTSVGSVDSSKGEDSDSDFDALSDNQSDCTHVSNGSAMEDGEEDAED